MHYIMFAILSRLSRFPAPAVGTNWSFCVYVPLNISQLNISIGESGNAIIMSVCVCVCVSHFQWKVPLVAQFSLIICFLCCFAYFNLAVNSSSLRSYNTSWVSVDVDWARKWLPTNVAVSAVCGRRMNIEITSMDSYFKSGCGLTNDTKIIPWPTSPLPHFMLPQLEFVYHPCHWTCVHPILCIFLSLTLRWLTGN